MAEKNWGPPGELMTEGELHDFGIQVVAKDLEKDGHEIVAYNRTVETFPGNVIAGMFGMQKLPQLSIPPEERDEVIHDHAEIEIDAEQRLEVAVVEVDIARHDLGLVSLFGHGRGGGWRFHDVSGVYRGDHASEDGASMLTDCEESAACRRA